MRPTENDKAVIQFQQLILIGRGKLDCVKYLAENLTTVSYYDGGRNLFKRNILFPCPRE
jgi:hypothetical protein